MSAEVSLDVAPIPRMLWAETRAKLLSRLRAPAFSVLSIVLPTMFFALFFGIFSNQKGVPVNELAKYFLAAYATYGVANVMVFNFGIFIPINQLPSAIQGVGKLLPLYHYSQLPLASVGQNTQDLTTATLWLIG